MYLGIDIGTSSVKAVLVDETQTVIEQATAPLSVSRPQPLWSEQNPDDWWTASCKAVCGLSSEHRKAVQAIGLSGQMHGATVLDEKNTPLRPAILWNDGRSASSCETMTQDFPDLHDITGNLAMPGFTAPKLHWLREHEPELFEQIATVLLPKDFVRLKMTGVAASDMSDSAGTLWMDVGARDWSDAMLELTGLSRRHMPELFEGSQATATLLPDIASDWGMNAVPVAAGAGDNAAGAIGSGVIEPKSGFVSLGTSGVVFVSDDWFRPNVKSAVHTFCHALPGLWHQMSVTLSAASAVDFVANATGYRRQSDLYEQLGAARKPADRALFLPYLSGERTPHNDPDAKGAFFGLTHDDTPLSLGQAALEGVAFALADGVDAMVEAGTSIETLSVIGGGSRSDWWGTVIASAMDMPLTYRDSSEVGPAFGAARLARLSVTGEDPRSVCIPPPVSHVVEPDPELTPLYVGRRETFSKLYHATKDLV